MKDKVIYCNNSILNLPGFNSTAAVSINLRLGDKYTEDSKEHKPNVTGGLCISDCNRVVELDLYATNKEEYANNLYKLKTLATLIAAAYGELLIKQQAFNEQWDRVELREQQEKLDKLKDK